MICENLCHLWLCSVVPTGIEPVCQVPETCVLSIVLRGQSITLLIHVHSMQRSLLQWRAKLRQKTYELQAGRRARGAFLESLATSKR